MYSCIQLDIIPPTLFLGANLLYNLLSVCLSVCPPLALLYMEIFYIIHIHYPFYIHEGGGCATLYTPETNEVNYDAFLKEYRNS